jgi:hypothetical protein
MTGVNVPRLRAALCAVQLTHGPPTSDLLVGEATNATGLPADQRQTIVQYLVSHGASGADASMTMEGIAAILEGANPDTTVTADDLRAAAAAGPVGPGPWAPPGNGWIGFYIGNSAHLGIAAEYRAAHTGQAVFTNFIPMSSILASLRIDPSVLGADAGLKPDIANVSPTKRHLYEIKPSGSEHIGGAEAAMYLGLFARAGYPMTLGSPGEPGTRGILPAPGGYYMFYCLTPGVISYKYRRGSFQPGTADAPERESSDIRLRLPPMSQQQQQAVAATGVMTIMMMIVVIALLPVGA